MRSRINIALLFFTMLIPWIANANPDDNMKATEYAKYDNAPMYCHSGIQVSVNELGFAVILPQMLLVEVFLNYDNFVVTIMDPPIGLDTVTCAEVGMTLDVMVTDTSTGNSCWTEVGVEDKLKPIIDCDSVILPCTVDPFNLPDSVKPSLLSDNCTAEADLDLTYTQSTRNLNCMTQPYVFEIIRNWTVTDASGNSSSCTQVILFRKGSLAEVDFPPDITLSCPTTDTDVSVTGEPTIDGQPLANLCMLVYVSMDETLPKCGNSSVIKRKFTVTDWCTTMSMMHTQFIHIVDTIPPTVYCPPDMTIEADTNCTADFVIPAISATDLCADDSDILFYYKVDDVFTTQMVTDLSLGDHEIKVFAYDPCFKVDSCSFTVTVEDNTPPVLVCHDVNIPLQPNGMVTIPYSYFNFAYFDNCEIVDTMVRRVVNHCPGFAGDLVFGDEVKFCCDDVGQQVMVAMKVTDIHGNSNVCMFNVLIKDNNGPAITCPADMTIECTQVDDGLYYGSPTINSGCPFDLDSSEVILIDDCGRGEIIRTFSVTSSTGNIVSCNQTITVINPFDFTNDSLMFPQDITITDCTPDTSVSNTGYPIILDNFCGNITVSYYDSIPNTPDACIEIYRIWDVFNACDTLAMFNDIQNITIKNSNPPVINAPANETFYVGVNCDVLVDLPPVVTDDCSTDITVTNDYNNQGGDITDITLNPGVYTIIFTAENACGLTSTDQTIITVLDNIPPVIDCPASVTLNCPADTSVSNTGLATATDNCTPPPTITYSDVVTPGACANTMSIVRTFVAEDAHGNLATCEQNIIVIDDTDPIISCPANMTLNCPADTSVANTGVATATEECNSPATISYTDVVVAGICPNTFTVTRTWMATDACGNFSTCEQTIVVEDDTDPIINCPANMTLNCPADTALSMTGTATATDECNANPVVSYTSNLIPGSCPNTFTLERTWMAMDACGNSSSCVQTIVVVDNTNPIINCPGNMTLNCPADTAVSSTGMATATDECNSPPTITYMDNVIPGLCANTFTVNRVWTAMDACGNSATCTQVINVVDNTNPLITCPGDMTLNCMDDTSPASTGTATATDECNNPPVVTMNDVVIPSGQCANTFTIERTWTATDACGNSASCIQTIVVVDNIDPMIACPPSITLDCPADTSTSNTGVATATDDCNNPPGISYSDNVVAGNCVNDFTINRTWTATDACGNTATCVQIIIVQDDSEPTITCPVDVTIDCPGDTTTANTGTATAIDACGAVFITYSDVVTQGSCPNNFSVIRTWTATDECGNDSTCIQNIVVQDVTDPVITCPIDMTITCGADTMPSATGMPTATDECNVAITFTYSDVVTPGSGNVIFTITRTWVAIDACGNTDDCDQTIVVLDAGAPSLACPADITAYLTQDSCNIFVAVPDPVVMDACSDVTVTNDGNGDDLLDASGIYPLGMTTITYTAIDASGNDTTCQTTITVLDTVSPSIACPADMTVDCNENLSPLSQYGSPTFDDNCPMNLSLVTMDSVFNLNACGTGTIDRIFVVEDGSGNTATCTQTITVDGTSVLDSLDILWPAPVVEVYDCIEFEDITLTAPALDPGVFTCNVINVDSSTLQIIPATLGCTTYQVTYVVTDSCNFDPNTGAGQWTFNQLVGIFDTIAPVITPLADLDTFYADTNCMAVVNIPTVTATDCNPVTITNNSPFATNGGANASGTYPGGITTVQFTATDACGNTDTTYSIDIFVADTIPPDLICFKTELQLDDVSLTYTLNANDAGIAFSSVSDNCTATEDIILTFDLNDLSDTLIVYDCSFAQQIVFVMVYAIDAQGNIDSCESEFGIDDQNLCPTSIAINIGGSVSTSLNQSVEDVEISMPMGREMMYDMSNDLGEFMFEDIPSDGTHRLDAHKEDLYLNGVTAYDLSILFRHIAGIEELTDPYLYYAADVNGDRIIDIRDILELRKLLLGVQNELPVSSWTFYDAKYDLSTATNPFIFNVPNYVMVYEEQMDKMHSDFIGVKTGDLDFSADLGLRGSEERSINSTGIIIGKPETTNDGGQLIPVFVDDRTVLRGGQLELDYAGNHQIQEVIPNELMGLETNEINQQLIGENNIRIVWIVENEIADVSQPMFWIKVNSMENMNAADWTLNTDFYTEVFNQNGEKSNVELIVVNDQLEIEDGGFVLYQNVPNPFRNSTMIKFNLPEEAHFELSIYDVQGSLISSIAQQGRDGLNEVELTQALLKGNTGVLYYRLSTPDNHAVRKMVVEK